VRRLAVLLLLMVAPAAAFAGSAGTWSRLPAAPVTADQLRAAVWTGKQVLVFGRHAVTAKDARGNPYIVKTIDVAAAFDPARNTWRKLSPPEGAGYSPSYNAVWTGRRLLVWGPFDALSYDPMANTWRSLPRPPTNAGRLTVWTGSEVVGWGGGCCGDAFKDGAAFNPATNTWRRLAPSPLAGSQSPLGAWTGHELVIFVGNSDPDGKPWPARLARAAAYNPTTNSWRRIAPLPVGRGGANVIWDGHDVLVLGGSAGGAKPLSSVLAYNPSTNRWRRLAPMPRASVGAAAVWTGTRLLMWGGSAGSSVPLRNGLSYDPATNRWTTLPDAPFAAQDAAAAWTGRSLFVWKGAAAMYTP
jgi:N-acetylneuraminic acid mutarotase